MGGGATPRAASLQGRTDPGSRCPAGCSGNPGPPWGAQHDRPCGPPRAGGSHPGRSTTMPTKPKPETTDDAREQARRALQTSMDTRQ
ncbi:hypothetical protein GCM10027614_66950 [Micromonospora vulcania]